MARDDTIDVSALERKPARATVLKNINPGKNTCIFWVDEKEFNRDGTANPTLGWFKCKSPYNTDFVDALKISIPYRHRQWVPAEKVWAVSPEYSEDIINLAASFYERIKELDSDPNALASKRALGDKVSAIKESLKDKSDGVQNVLPQFSKRNVEV